MAQMDLGILSEDCIALSDALARKCDEDGHPVLALTLRQIALRYRLLLNKLYGIKTIPDVSPQLEAQIVISSTAPIAELIAAVEAEGKQPTDDQDWPSIVAGQRAAAVARAEAAETLENIIGALGLNPVDFSDELTEPLITGVIGAMQQRVNELETALAAERAAHQWRPVTEEWPPNNVQLLGRATLNSPTLLVTRTAGIWQNDDGVFLDAGEIGFCAPLPAAPQEPTP